MAKKEAVSIELKPINFSTATFHIVGDTDLELNKMNDPTARALTDARKGKAKAKEVPNYWEEVITAIHWRDGKPKEFTEESLKDALKNNAPCITAFGFKKSLGEAVTRNGIDHYSTKLDATINIIAKGGLIPIKFATHEIVEKLMSPKRGAPVLSKINRFSGWSADITIQFLDTAYSVEQLTDIVRMAGFGIGIGSGRRGDGYGRYSIESVDYVGNA